MDEHQFSFLGHLPLTQQALRYAEQHHAGQTRRADGASYLLHLLEVASLLDRSGYPDHVVAAAVLHDVLEDTDVERAQLEERFGAEIANLVAAVSDDPAISDEEARKDAVRDHVREVRGEAIVVYAADKVSKVRELRLSMTTNPDDPEIPVRLARYRKSLAMLQDTIPGSRLAELLRFELDALEQLPPATR